MDAEGEIAAIFTLTHKAVEIGNADISSTMRRKLSRYAQLDGNTNSYTVSAFLIAQFRKNYGFKGNLELSGNALMDDAFEILGRAQFEFVVPANSYNGMDGRRADNAQMKMWLSAL